jgi:UDP-N-acetylglucosamine 1-carboxyvinyltransferase
MESERARCTFAALIACDRCRFRSFPIASKRERFSPPRPSPAVISTSPDAGRITSMPYCKRCATRACEIETGKNSIRCRGSLPPKSFDITTAPYPGFPTDMQAQMMALASIGDGVSRLTDTIYTDRFTHVAELVRLGADVRLEGNTAVVRPVGGLSGARVMASDLRASAALIVAGLVAKGQTHVSRVYHIDRGYERIEEKLRNVGASIERVREEDP